MIFFFFIFLIFVKIFQKHCPYFLSYSNFVNGNVGLAFGLGWLNNFHQNRVLTKGPRFPSTSKSSNPRDTWVELRLHVQHTNPVFDIILFNLNIYPWLQCITRVSISNFYFYLFTVKLRQSWNPTWWAPPLRQPYIGSGHHLPNLLRLLFFQCFP